MRENKLGRTSHVIPEVNAQCETTQTTNRLLLVAEASAEAGKLMSSYIHRIHSIFDFSLYMLRRRGSPRWQLPRPVNPGLVPLGQFRNNVLFYLLCVTARVDRIGSNTQPVGADVARGGAAIVPRNEHYLIFTSMEVVPDNEMMSITL